MLSTPIIEPTAGEEKTAALYYGPSPHRTASIADRREPDPDRNLTTADGTGIEPTALHSGPKNYWKVY